MQPGAEVAHKGQYLPLERNSSKEIKIRPRVVRIQDGVNLGQRRVDKKWNVWKSKGGGGRGNKLTKYLGKSISPTKPSLSYTCVCLSKALCSFSDVKNDLDYLECIGRQNNPRNGMR